MYSEAHIIETNLVVVSGIYLDEVSTTVSILFVLFQSEEEIHKYTRDIQHFRIPIKSMSDQALSGQVTRQRTVLAKMPNLNRSNTQESSFHIPISAFIDTKFSSKNVDSFNLVLDIHLQLWEVG